MEDKVIQQSFTFKNSDRMTAQAKKTATNIQKRKLAEAGATGPAFAALQGMYLFFDFYYQYHLQNQNPEDDSKYQTKHCRPI